ncbi:helix-turn-helix domain-containing protein [Paenibacillus arenilitoris]|uniref:Helix-turn-helix transcriptional regulator n=1 Tax=Paenibacillus arenilitoris TaxID=2772299 RepID=A0A927CIU1_9BACL|nr:AraC family transcriptional regulator [Paenibacillus arenilitoris]MBD2868888.1 helix-turn-helix transcriptional regulator [Paenibacillus arenilitoris]
MLAINVEIVPRVKIMGFIAYKSPWLHFKRKVNEYVLYFIRSGELHIREEDRRYALRKGDLFILEPNMEHEGTEKHTCDYYYIHYEHPATRTVQIDDMLATARYLIARHEQPPVDQPERDANGIGPYDCYFPKYHTIADKTRFQQTVHAMNEMLQLYKRKHYNRSLAALRLTGLLIDLSRDHFTDELQKSDRFHSKAIVKVNAVIDYIHQNYQSKITGDDIERLFETNFDYLNRAFKKATGQPIGRYINTVRIRQAKELIETTPLGIGEIGYLTGLSDPYHFSKVFKKYVGVSPTQYYKNRNEID